MAHHLHTQVAVALFISFASVISPLRAEKVKKVPLNTGIRTLVERTLAVTDRKRIRLAVLPFSPTGNHSAADTRFGEYFSDRLITGFSKNKRCILYERGRLDALSKELALNLTGLIDENAAKKIGEMAPLDYLMTGTYTRLKSSIEINARLLDVITGEITFGYTGKIELNSKLAALFPQDNQTTRPESTPAADLENATPDCKTLLEKARALAKMNNHPSLVSMGQGHLLTSPCGSINRDIIDYFIESNYFDNSYRKWLRKELVTLSEPDRYRSIVGSIIRYFSADGNVEVKEWESFTSLLKYAQKRDRSFYVRCLFSMSPFLQNNRQWRSRMDEYITTVSLPDSPPKSSDRVASFFFLVPTSIESEPSEHYRYWFKNHLEKLDDKDAGDLLDDLAESYFPAFCIRVDSSAFTSRLGDIIAAINHCPPEKKSALAVHSLIKKLQEASSERFRDEWIPYFSRQFDRLMTECRPAIARIYADLPESVVPYCTGYCLRYDIQVPGKLPTLDEVVLRLKDPHIRKRIEASELLAEAGNRSRLVVPQIKQALERSIVNSGERGNPNFQYALIEALANSGTTDAATHSVLISMYELPSHTGVPQKTVEALSRMGTVLLPSFKKAYPEKPTEVQLYIIKTLKTMGTRAKKTVPWLQSLRGNAPIECRDAIDDAIEAINR
jgi:TolB-like protein